MQTQPMTVKKCPYCGKKYADEVTICDFDGNATVLVDPPSNTLTKHEKSTPNPHVEENVNKILNPSTEIASGIFISIGSALLVVLAIIAAYCVWTLQHPAPNVLRSENPAAKAFEMNGNEAVMPPSDPLSSTSTAQDQHSHYKMYWFVWLFLFGLGGIFKGIAKINAGSNALKTRQKFITNPIQKDCS